MDWDCIFVLTVAVVTSSHAVGWCRNNMSVWHALWQCSVSLKMSECLPKHHWGFSKWNMDNYSNWFIFLMKILISHSGIPHTETASRNTGNQCLAFYTDPCANFHSEVAQNFSQTGSLFTDIWRRTLRYLFLFAEYQFGLLNINIAKNK